MVHHLSRADGPLREHIRLAPVMALAVDVLQRAEQEIPGILTERRSRAAAVDKPVCIVVGIILSGQLRLQSGNRFIGQIVQLCPNQLPAGITQWDQRLDAG